MKHLGYKEFNEKIGNSKEGINFNSLTKENIIIDFYAPWCGPCKVLSPILEQIENENENIKVYKINVDEESKLASEMGIRSIPTMIILKNGEKNQIKIGLLDKSNILNLFN